MTPESRNGGVINPSGLGLGKSPGSLWVTSQSVYPIVLYDLLVCVLCKSLLLGTLRNLEPTGVLDPDYPRHKVSVPLTPCLSRAPNGVGISSDYPHCSLGLVPPLV